MQVLLPNGEHPSLAWVWSTLTSGQATRVYLWPGNQFFALGDVFGILGKESAKDDRKKVVLVQLQYSGNQGSGCYQMQHWGFTCLRSDLGESAHVLIARNHLAAPLAPGEFFLAVPGDQMQALHKATLGLENDAEKGLPHSVHDLLSQPVLNESYQWGRRASMVVASVLLFLAGCSATYVDETVPGAVCGEAAFVGPDGVCTPAPELEEEGHTYQGGEWAY